MGYRRLAFICKRRHLSCGDDVILSFALQEALGRFAPQSALLGGILRRNSLNIQLYEVYWGFPRLRMVLGCTRLPIVWCGQSFIQLLYITLHRQNLIEPARCRHIRRESWW